MKDRPLVGCMMFGVTTPCVLRAQKHMEMEGYEVLINHCTGAGGRSMEEMLEEGYISGMLDLTTEEVTADVLIQNTSGLVRQGFARRQKRNSSGD